MAIPNPEHLFEQAEKLVASPTAGPPRQVDIRRAISAAYYGVFHSILTAAADRFVGVTRRAATQYGLVYRSVDHGWLRRLCEEVSKPSPPPKYAEHAPPGGFGSALTEFADGVIELQERRQAADYDPLIRVKRADAVLAVRTARTALQRFNAADPAAREAFLSLLLFRPR